MQSNGAREAIETIRKKLKHGGTQQKLRALEVLKLLMENSNQQFHRQFLMNDKMKERFELILTSQAEDVKVKNELLSLLGAWVSKYKDEPGMRTMADLYELGRGRKLRIRTNTAESSRSNTSDTIVRSPTTNTQSPMTSPIREQPQQQQRHQSLPPPIMPIRSPITEPKVKNKPRSQSNAGSTSRNNTTLFNFEKTKPKILEEIALANQNSNNLINALRLINTTEDRWEIDLQHDKRLQEYRDKCEESKKKIVRYARLVEDEEWIGTLLAANEDLLKALDMYDIMLVGEIPASWSPMSPNSNNRKAIRAPPPPPPIKRQTSPLQLEFSNLNINHKQKHDDELDPFADPTTPIEEIENHHF
ncbi:hypothetical protein RMATCC62417_00095 [Rhizopus microsporus]|nr:hypothetical protein RMATCC62417_00095 [Rhizopus microsporus]